MKILFESSCLIPDRLSGVGVYAKNLYSTLKNLGTDIRPVINWSRGLKESHVEKHIHKKAELFFPLPLLRSKKAIFHGPDFRLAPGSGRFPTVVTIHDLAVFHAGFNEESFRQRGMDLFRGVINQNPDHIVVPSKFVAEELQDLFPQTKGKVSAIYHGADHLNQCRSSQSIDAFKNGGYFLYVGHIETRKNVGYIIEAFEKFAEKTPDIKLVLVGKLGFQGEELMARAQSSRVKNRIELKGFVGEKELEDLYSSALAFLFPSKYEGFGFPILEAMRLGSPVISSSLGTMAEVAGSAALLVDPNRSEDLSEKMLQLISDSSLRGRLIEGGLTHSMQFTWERSAKEYLKVYQSLMEA